MRKIKMLEDYDEVIVEGSVVSLYTAEEASELVEDERMKEIVLQEEEDDDILDGLILVDVNDLADPMIKMMMLMGGYEGLAPLKFSFSMWKAEYVEGDEA